MFNENTAVMMSVNPPYSKMILNGYKPFEFRNVVLRGMKEGYPLEDIKAYIYETKHKGGSGKVIGEVTVSGCYSLHYADHKFLDTELICLRNTFIKTLYLHWCELKDIRPNMNEGWFKSKRFWNYLKEIGYDSEDKQKWNYAMVLDDPKTYETSKALSEFKTTKGTFLVRPPQNMFTVCAP